MVACCFMIISYYLVEVVGLGDLLFTLGNNLRNARAIDEAINQDLGYGEELSVRVQ